MCCKICPKYFKCYKKERIADICCEECPQYYNCVGTLADDVEEDFEEIQWQFEEKYENEKQN